MYIPEFWCGVLATLMVEFVLAFISNLFVGRGDGDEAAEKTD